MKTNRKQTVLIVAFVLVLVLLFTGDGMNDWDSRSRSADQADRIESNTADIKELIEEMRLLRESIEKLNDGN